MAKIVLLTPASSDSSTPRDAIAAPTSTTGASRAREPLSSTVRKVLGRPIGEVAQKPAARGATLSPDLAPVAQWIEQRFSKSAGAGTVQLSTSGERVFVGPASWTAWSAVLTWSSSWSVRVL